MALNAESVHGVHSNQLTRNAAKGKRHMKRVTARQRRRSVTYEQMMYETDNVPSRDVKHTRGFWD